MRTIYGRLVVALAALVASFAVAQAETQLDPADVSAGLKAIFRYGTSTRQVVDRLNSNTVTLMSGTIGGTYVQIGADLASVLDNGDDLRVLPVVGRGSVQSVADILYLKGVDIGIVRSDTLDYL
ncbi:MAG: TRAP transporter substrate-binding protein, partial [Xanthobacteraceae bacterium]